MTKKLKYLLLALVLVLIGVGFFYTKNSSSLPSQKNISQDQVTLTIDYGNGKKETASFTPQVGQTAFGILKSFTQEKGIPLDTQQYDFGVFVKTIGMYPSTKDFAWIYFVNGASGTIAADKQEVKSGDTVEWRYTKPQE